MHALAYFLCTFAGTAGYDLCAVMIWEQLCWETEHKAFFSLGSQTSPHHSLPWLCVRGFAFGKWLTSQCPRKNISDELKNSSKRKPPKTLCYLDPLWTQPPVKLFWLSWNPPSGSPSVVLSRGGDSSALSPDCHASHIQRVPSLCQK